MARDFPGSNGNYVGIGDVSAIDITGTALTVAAWIYPDAIVAGGGVCTKSSNTVTGIQWMLYVDNNGGGRILFLIGDSGGLDSVSYNTVYSGAWHHFAGVKNGTGAGALKLYYDGVAAASASSSKSIQNTAYSCVIGNRSTNDQPFDGKIGEVAIWSVALSDAELAALAKGVSPRLIRPGSLNGYWPLWGVAYPEPDLSGNVNNASQTGTVGAANHPPAGPPVLV